MGLSRWIGEVQGALWMAEIKIHCEILKELMRTFKKKHSYLAEIIQDSTMQNRKYCLTCKQPLWASILELM